jgi:hypothetical protein
VGVGGGDVVEEGGGEGRFGRSERIRWGWQGRITASQTKNLNEQNSKTKSRS